MYRLRINILIGIFFFVTAASAQENQDSLAVVSKDWKKTNVKKGVVWKQGHFNNLFDGEQEINYVEIDLKKNLKNLYLAAEPSELKPTSQLASEHGALVAINGGFFDMKNGGATDFIQVENKVVNRTRKKTDRGNALLLLSKKEIKIKAATDTLYESEHYPNVMLAGPMLVRSGNPYPLTKNAFNDNRHPRTAVALTDDDKLLLFVVDGRNKSSHGMDLHELSSVLRWLGAKEAMNLDGGGSSTLYIKGATENGLVSYPSDNKLFDHEGERAVANIIYIK
ncbi:phosphodiester glycosidase family protein [Sphingobacterium phlebotomi]|uniref:Phosphodiester glycosidase family protein n=1 Tax=Sphingobacterium phlebotomi TaxID=2605433 RepID=A0A5D4H2K2_9SPHI|nr:phosphodiester glycosidase family protein [Sphingobacterium phlebotomi]TYR34473.1 phosphodiester glycosidase family protein [Sphingobacterium phlebotomi]